MEKIGLYLKTFWRGRIVIVLRKRCRTVKRGLIIKTWFLIVIHSIANRRPHKVLSNTLKSGLRSELFQISIWIEWNQPPSQLDCGLRVSWIYITSNWMESNKNVKSRGKIIITRRAYSFPSFYMVLILFV